MGKDGSVKYLLGWLSRMRSWGGDAMTVYVVAEILNTGLGILP